MEPDKLKPKRKRLSRQEQKEQTRQRFLDAAVELFAIRGYEGTTVEQIAEHAGYSRGAFYSNFSHKEELMRALIQQGFDGDIAGIRKIADLSGIDELAKGYRKLSESFYDDPMNLLWMLEFQLAAVRHPEIRAEYAKTHRTMREAVRQQVSQYMGKEDNEATLDEVESADILLVISSGLGLFRLIYGEEIRPEIFERALRLVLQGLSPPDPAAAPGQGFLD